MIGAFYFAHALAATTGGGFDQHGIADFLGFLGILLGAGVLAGVEGGDHGHAGFDHLFFGVQFVAHAVDHFRGGPNENDLGFLAAARKTGVFRQETVTRMNGVDLVILAYFKNLVLVQVRFQRGGAAQGVGFVGALYVQRVFVHLGVDGAGHQAHLL